MKTGAIKNVGFNQPSGVTRQLNEREKLLQIVFTKNPQIVRGNLISVERAQYLTDHYSAGELARFKDSAIAESGEGSECPK